MEEPTKVWHVVTSISFRDIYAVYKYKKLTYWYVHIYKMHFYCGDIIIDH